MFELTGMQLSELLRNEKKRTTGSCSGASQSWEQRHRIGGIAFLRLGVPCTLGPAPCLTGRQGYRADESLCLSQHWPFTPLHCLLTSARASEEHNAM